VNASHKPPPGPNAVPAWGPDAVVDRFDQVNERFDLADETVKTQVALALDALVTHGLQVNKQLDHIEQRLKADTEACHNKKLPFASDERPYEMRGAI